jgi:hypothetical protein
MTSRPADQQTSRPADQQTSRPADQQTRTGEAVDVFATVSGGTTGTTGTTYRKEIVTSGKPCAATVSGGCHNVTTKKHILKVSMVCTCTVYVAACTAVFISVNSFI